ncbi:MAG: PTS sugar transporter subunit IIA [Planctomycetota bacterium]
MLVSQVLEHHRIALGSPPFDKWEAIRFLVDLMRLPCGLPGAPASWAKAVLDRERQLSTGLEAGIALPHGMLTGDFEARGALMVHPGGLEFEALDGAPVHFVLLVLFPDTDSGKKRHVELLGSAIRMFTDAPFREELLGQQDSAAALATLGRAEARILS